MIRFIFQIRFTIFRSKRKRNPKQSKNTKETGFLSYARKAVRSMEGIQSVSTCRNYKTALLSLEKFLTRDISVSQLTAEKIEQYEHWLLNHNVTYNTVSCYMRSLRSLYNHVVEKHRLRHKDPFVKVFTGNERTAKRSVTEREMQRLRRLQLIEGSFLCMVRDVFLFCFYAMGMPFIDAAFLRKSQIEGGVIVYKRRKTRQMVRVKIEPCMRQIMHQYEDDKSEFVFPFIRQDSIDSMQRQYNSALGRYNLALRKLGDMIGVKSRLTSYVARHTWASMAHKRNVDMSIISQALGHTSQRTTLIYIKELDDERMAQANEKIIKETFSTPLDKRHSERSNKLGTNILQTK